MPETVTAPCFTTRELNDALGTQAWRIARLFELGIVPEPPRSGGRRLIPKSMAPVVMDALCARGWVPMSDKIEEAVAAT